MQVKCEGPGCGEVFEAKRASARFHSERCKKRAQRSPGNAPSRPAVPPQQQAVAAPTGGLLAATAAKLVTAGRLDGPEGQAALILAARIEMSAVSAETGAGVASLVKQYHATMAEALKDAGKATSPLDELRSRRERKLSAG